MASLAVLATVCWIFDDDTALAVHSVGGGLLVNSNSLLPAALTWDVATFTCTPGEASSCRVSPA